jgi:hypothetical protein
VRDRSLPAPLFAEEYLGISRIDAHQPIIGAASIIEGLAWVTKDLTASVTGYNVSAGEAAGGVADDPILAIADVGCIEHDVSLGPFSDLINNLLSGGCVCGLPGARLWVYT